ncbi:hypothetical protein U9K52_12115 [Chryseobacterium sp. MHB01]|uniref:hypothetical protein n=1 Tax=Chryseobacterium sp. MHB01 TaxID=3109433 RepID=UPI002AFEE841|nr:hypothetical protein [Chryseobacterium sp. MHB01]MEA1849660.1 hypothetical protein [Chryseobacterium sp. MHB01]
MLSIILFATQSLLTSCGQNSNRSPGEYKGKSPDKPIASVIEDTAVTSETEMQKPTADTSIEIMNEKDILFNGKLKRYFSLSKFHSMLGKPDSVKLLSDEEPCTNIFQEPDGTIDPQTKYLFKNGTRFENFRDKVAIDEVRFNHGDFIVFHHRRLDNHSTLDDLKDLFPNAVKKIRAIEVPGVGKLQVIQLREDRNNASDGHINMMIRKGKLYSLKWWFPC